MTLQEVKRGQRPVIWLSTIDNDIVRLNSGYVVWGWHYTNYGKSPANNVLFSVGMNLGGRALSASRELTTFKNAAPLPQTKDDMSAAVSSTTVTVRMFNSLIASDEQIVVYGKFYYTDVSDFCFSRLRTGAAKYCEERGANYIK